MKTVKRLLQTKGCPYYSVGPEEQVLDAMRLLKDRNVDVLVVLEDNKLVGILTETDYIRKVLLRGRSARHLLVQDIMTRKVITVSPQEEWEDCIEKMTRYDVQRLPVLDGDQVIGMLSISDAVQAMLTHQRDTIQFLEDMLLAA